MATSSAFLGKSLTVNHPFTSLVEAAGIEPFISKNVPNLFSLCPYLNFLTTTALDLRVALFQKVNTWG